MKNIILLFILSFFIFSSCDDDDDNANQNFEEFLVEDKVYRLSNMIITEPIDLNGDGVYSLDVMEEDNPCGISSYTIGFSQEKSIHPAWIGLSLNVEPDTNGELEQILGCGTLDGILPFWQQNDNTIIFYYDTWQSPDIFGELSEDGQQITLNAAFNSGAIFHKEILTEDGTVIEYQDDIKLVYTLEE